MTPLPVCREVIEFLADYLDGALPFDRSEAFARHLALCDSCTAYLAMYEATIRLARSAENAPELCDMPEELVEAILGGAPPQRG